MKEAKIVKIDINSEEYKNRDEEFYYGSEEEIYKCEKHGLLKFNSRTINEFNGNAYCLECPKTREQIVYEISRDVGYQVEYFLKHILELNANSEISRLKNQLKGWVSNQVVIDGLLGIIVPECLNQFKDNKDYHRCLKAFIFQSLLKNENIK